MCQRLTHLCAGELFAECPIVKEKPLTAVRLSADLILIGHDCTPAELEVKYSAVLRNAIAKMPSQIPVLHVCLAMFKKALSCLISCSCRVWRL